MLQCTVMANDKYSNPSSNFPSYMFFQMFGMSGSSMLPGMVVPTGM